MTKLGKEQRDTSEQGQNDSIYKFGSLGKVKHFESLYSTSLLSQSRQIHLPRRPASCAIFDRAGKRST